MITVTSRAAALVKQRLESSGEYQDGLSLRIARDHRSSSNYIVYFDVPDDTDIESIHEGVSVVVDHLSAVSLAGAVIDTVNGHGPGRFEIRLPRREADGIALEPSPFRGVASLCVSLHAHIII